MQITRSAGGALCLSAAVALLAGCGSSGSQPLPAPGGASQSVRSEHAGAGRLLYISDYAANAVYMYSASGKLRGSLSGPIIEPQGMCVDSKQNVYVTNSDYGETPQVLEYAHGGTTPIATYNLAQGDYPLGCAVDSKGDLAVTNGVGNTTSDGIPGTVWIFTSPSSPPKQYTISNEQQTHFLGYDTSGDLVVSGMSVNPTTQDYNGQLAELKAGATKFTRLKVHGAPDRGTLHDPGTVQYVGNNVWIIGDQNANASGNEAFSVMYQATIGKRAVTITHTTVFAEPGASGGLAMQCYLYGGGTKILVPDAQSANASIYSFPGGDAIRIFSPLIQPFGAVVSE
jgi:hypothetical protein